MIVDTKTGNKKGKARLNFKKAPVEKIDEKNSKLQMKKTTLQTCSHVYLQ